MIFKAKQGINLIDQPGHSHDLFLDLLRGHENVGVILIEAPYPHKAVELP